MRSRLAAWVGCALAWVTIAHAKQLNIETATTIFSADLSTTVSSTLATTYNLSISDYWYRDVNEFPLEGILYKFTKSRNRTFEPDQNYYALLNFEEVQYEVMGTNDFTNPKTNGILVYRDKSPISTQTLSWSANRPVFLIDAETAKKLEQQIDDTDSDNPSYTPNKRSVRRVPNAKYAQRLYARLELTSGDGSSKDQPASASSNTVMYVAIAAGVILAVILAIMFSFWFMFTRRKRRFERSLAALRAQGISTLEHALGDEKIKPLDPLLLHYLGIIDTKKQDLSKLPKPSTNKPQTGSGKTSQSEQGEGAVPAATEPEPAQPGITEKVVQWTAKLVQSKSSGSTGDMGQSTSIVGRLREITSLSTSSLRSSHDKCAICLEHLRREKCARQLPCHHVYHMGCIDQWLTEKSAICPICRFDCAKYCLAKAGPKARKDLKESSGSTTDTETNSFYLY
ncbi:hypothetical protein H4R34_001792 [Dimargaris verticillata]|uniref:RING-type domain-containing protein n=1 Tax=Dimargaris verticillata TaxID=2761393 RepID=A0A9W8E9Y1_9FUNG|nr:hypothetical protein H4R34_001792 [Dimargaris verticillata]